LSTGLKPEHWIAIAQIIITIAGVYFGPLWAVKRSLKQFRSQKWLEEQQETYTTLLEYVSVIQCDAAGQCEAIQLHWDRTPGEYFKEKLRPAYVGVEIHAALGAYVISPAAASGILNFQKAISRWAIVTDGDPYERCNAVVEAAKECIRVLTAQAKRALL